MLPVESSFWAVLAAVVTGHQGSWRRHGQAGGRRAPREMAEATVRLSLKAALPFRPTCALLVLALTARHSNRPRRRWRNKSCPPELRSLETRRDAGPSPVGNDPSPMPVPCYLNFFWLLGILDSWLTLPETERHQRWGWAETWEELITQQMVLPK